MPKVISVFVATILIGLFSGCMDAPADRAASGGVRFEPPSNPGGPAVAFPDFKELPESARPNDATISLYEDRRREWRQRLERSGDIFVIRPAGNAAPFRRSPNIGSSALDAQLNEGYLLNYMFFENGAIRYDGLAANGRFRRDLNNDTLFFTHSTGKSITSYILGHAICEGHISSIDEVIDWPMMSETLYQGQPLRNLLNMRAGDRHVVNHGSGRIVGSSIHHRDMGIDTAAFLLRDTERRGAAFYYNDFLTDVVEGYTAFRVGRDYRNLVRRVFRERIKIEDEVVLFQRPTTLTNGARSPYFGQPQARAANHYLITRMDFLRVAVAMMEDYQSNNCVGRYLRQLQAQAVPSGFLRPNDNNSWMWLHSYARQYGGKFYFDFVGMRGRNIMGTMGLNGQNILMDLDAGRIVVTNAAATGWDVKSLVVDVIRDGRLPD